MRTDSYKWTFTSTGAGGWHDLNGFSDLITFYIEASSVSSGTVLFQTAISSASTPVGTLGSTSGYALSTGQARTISFNQALGVVRPRLTDASTLSATTAINVRLIGQGSW